MEREFLIKASVQYNDIIGTIAADLQDTLLWQTEYLAKIGFNANEYYPFAYDFTLAEQTIKKYERRAHFVIYAVRKDVVGENIDAVLKYIEENQDKLPVTKFTTQIAINDFFDLFKRFSINFSRIRLNKNYYENTIQLEEIKEITLDN